MITRDNEGRNPFLIEKTHCTREVQACPHVAPVPIEQIPCNKDEVYGLVDSELD